MPAGGGGGGVPMMMMMVRGRGAMRRQPVLVQPFRLASNNSRNRLLSGATTSLQFHLQTGVHVVMRAQVLPAMAALHVFPHDNNNEQALPNESDDNSENGSRTDDIIHLDCSSPACSDDDDGG
jgi:hypothetical protein